MSEWQRRKGESSQAFAAFQVYLELGAERSVAGAYRQKSGKHAATQAPGQWNLWATQWEWVARATAYDNHLSRIRQAATEAAVEAEARKWEERRSALREREWTMADRLLERAEKMLEHPLTRTKGEDGKTVVPAGWRQVDVAAMVEMASKVARLATEMETDRTKHDVGDIDPVEHLLRRLDGLAVRFRTAETAGGDEQGGGGAAAV